MALKNLVAQKAALTEEAIESIVSEYIRYDTDEGEIAFTPEFTQLGNRAKILVYLVALQGWSFVSDETISASAKPADLQEILGIPGGTLRPALKELKDGHLIALKNGSYSVRASNLASIKAAVGSPSRATRRKTGPKKTPRKKGDDSTPSDSDQDKTGPSRRKNTGLKRMIDDWIAEGYFDSGKTTADVKDRFHEEAIIVPLTSIPGYLIKAVRKDKTLSRKKEDVDGRNVWVYRTKK